MENQPVMHEFKNKKGVQSRWIAITALLLGVGAILHLISPNVGGITPNWMIAMYCIAINLLRPTFSQTAGIGLVAGALIVPTSKSAFPYGNFVSELGGALTCALIVHLGFSFTIGKLNLKPAVSSFAATLVSGTVFCGILKIVTALPMHVFLYAMLPVVFTVAVTNVIVTQLLFFPVQKLLSVVRHEEARN